MPGLAALLPRYGRQPRVLLVQLRNAALDDPLHAPVRQVFRELAVQFVSGTEITGLTYSRRINTSRGKLSFASR